MKSVSKAVLAAAVAAMLASPLSAVERDLQPPLKPGFRYDYSTNDRFIIKFRDSDQTVAAATYRERALNRIAASRGFKAQPLRQMALGAEVVRLSRKLDRVEAEAFLEQLRADPAVEYAEPDLRMKPAYTPNDPLYSLQWHYNHPVGGINLPLAWNTSQGSGAVVAVLDTGITNHPDLNAQVLPGYDFISDIVTANDGNGRDNNPADPGDWVEADECEDGAEAEDSSWHGTHVAGTVAAHTNNGVGVAGVAPQAKIVPVRVLGKCGGFTSDIVDAIVWASGGAVSGVPVNANPAEVINLSLGGEGSCGTSYRNAINGAVARGSVVVVAAGNGNTSVEAHSPSNCPNVIAVASSDQDGTRSDFSNAGGIIDVTAPGGEGTSPDGPVGIASTADSGLTVPDEPGYYYYQGTSMAAPHVAGVVALMQSLSPNTPAEVERILKLTSKPIAPFSCPGGCGAGKIDAYAALRGVAGILPAAPIATLRNGTTIPVPAGAAGTWTRFSLPNISRGMNLSFTLKGGTGNGDLYVKFGAPPTLTDYDCRSTNVGNSEVCKIPEMQEGNYYAYVRGAAAHSGARLVTSHYARVFLNREDVTIPDLGTAQSPILVLRRTGRALARTLVRVEVAHTYSGDIKLDLVGPSGAVYPLQDMVGGDTDHIIRQYYVNASAETANGTWYLRARDEGPEDVGHINQWHLRP